MRRRQIIAAINAAKTADPVKVASLGRVEPMVVPVKKKAGKKKKKNIVCPTCDGFGWV